MVTVLRGAIAVTDVEIERLRRSAAAARARPIFNPDENRLQWALRKNTPLAKKLHRVLVGGGWMEGRSLGSIVALMSVPVCQQQEWHTDYDPLKLTAVLTKPLGVIVALQPDTLFEEYPDKQHRLGRGDVLIFEGDVVHAGAAYDHENVRLHAYVDSNDMARRKNKTYLLRSDSSPPPSPPKRGRPPSR